MPVLSLKNKCFAKQRQSRYPTFGISQNNPISLKPSAKTKTRFLSLVAPMKALYYFTIQKRPKAHYCQTGRFDSTSH